MREFKKLAFQGDVAFLRVDELPEGLKEAKGENGVHIVAHSETGHHHTIDAAAVQMFPVDNFESYMKVNVPTHVVHERAWDTHEPIKFDVGIYKINRQKEKTPEGWRRVAD